MFKHNEYLFVLLQYWILARLTRTLMMSFCFACFHFLFLQNIFNLVERRTQIFHLYRRLLCLFASPILIWQLFSLHLTIFVRVIIKLIGSDPIRHISAFILLPMLLHHVLQLNTPSMIQCVHLILVGFNLRCKFIKILIVALDNNCWLSSVLTQKTSWNLSWRGVFRSCALAPLDC